MDILLRIWNYLASRVWPFRAGKPQPQPPPPRKKSVGELILEAWEIASRPGSNVVELRFDADGSGRVIDTGRPSLGGADIIISPICNFPLRPRPVSCASPAMVYLQDGRPLPSLSVFQDGWPTQEARLPDPPAPPGPGDENS